MKNHFVKWFDPSNIEHLKAYKHLQDTGCWPEGFRPKDLEMPANWQFLLISKIAEYFVRKTLRDEG